MKPSMVAVYVFRRNAATDGTAGGQRSHIELLQLRRTGQAEYASTWHNVYGGVEAGETAAQAAVRELREETGLEPIGFFQVEHVETFYFGSADEVVLMPVFGAEVEPSGVVRLDEEHDDWRWIPASDAEHGFMWRSQRDSVRVLVDQLARDDEAHRRLQWSSTFRVAGTGE